MKDEYNKYYKRTEGTELLLHKLARNNHNDLTKSLKTKSLITKAIVGDII